MEGKPSWGVYDVGAGRAALCGTFWISSGLSLSPASDLQTQSAPYSPIRGRSLSSCRPRLFAHRLGIARQALMVFFADWPASRPALRVFSADRPASRPALRPAVRPADRRNSPPAGAQKDRVKACWPCGKRPPRRRLHNISCIMNHSLRRGSHVCASHSSPSED